MTTKIDTSKPVYLAMDHTIGSGSWTSQDQTILTNIKNLLEKAGFTVKKTWGGAGTDYDVIKYLYNNNIKNSIIFDMFNGVDPSCIRQVAKNKRYDNRGYKVRNNGNEAVLGWFYGACDCVHSTGACYTHVRASETGAAMANPKAFMDAQDIKYFCNRSDKTGTLSANSFISLFTTTTTDPVTPVPPVTPVTTNKKIGEYTVQTDENGVFSQQLVLPEIGLYEADLTYPGSTYYENSSTSIKITYNGSSTIVTPTNPITPVPPVTPVTPSSGTYNPDTTTIIPLVDGKPDVTKFTNMSFADTTKTYTLTKDQFVSAFKRDMCSIYFNNALPKYVYFQQSTNSNYYVVSREHWNTLCHQMNHKLLMRQGTRNLGTSNYKNYIEAYPDTFTVNFNDTQYNYPLVRDRQNWTATKYGSCGPTSLSMCTQMLYTYYSEPDLRQEMGCWKTDTSPAQISNWINKSDNAIKCGSWIQGKSTSSWDKVKTALSNHYPVIMHIYGHYVCLFDVSADGTKVALANPSSNGYPSGLAPTKWNKISTLNSNLNILRFLVIMPDIGAYDNTTYKSIYNAYLSNYGGKWTPSSDTLDIIDDSGLYSGDLGA